MIQLLLQYPRLSVKCYIHVKKISKWYCLGLWVCLIYTCLQRMGVPTERGTVEVYTCLELHFFLFSCQCSLPYINCIFKDDYASIFIFYFYFFAFFHTMHINRIF